VDSFIQSIARGFDLKCVKSKVYKDKFGHICATTSGLVRIQRGSGRRGQVGMSHDNEVNAIIFQHEIKEHLHESGFTVDRLLISSQNVPYYSSDEGVYTASLVLNEQNADYADNTAFLGIIAHIAKMHNALRDTNIATRHVTSAGNSNNIAKLQDDMKTLRKKLLKTAKFSDFDMLFLRGYDTFAPHIIDFNDENPSGHICHNLLKEENIYKQNSNGNSHIAITNFSEASNRHQLHDLAYILKRYIKAKPQGSTPDIMPISRIVDEYAQNCSIPLDDALLRRILLYPDKLVKVVLDYYSKKRSFAPNTYITRMQECLRVGAILSEGLL